jgi:DNA modification methylase
MVRVNAQTGFASPSTDLAVVREVRHPAPFSNSIIDKLCELVPDGVYLDPFCGIGRVFQLTRDDRRFVGLELEREWAEQAMVRAESFGMSHTDVYCTDALKYMGRYAGAKSVKRFDGIVTSPVYGNRMSDHHNAQDMSTRRSYTHYLGHELTEGNSGAMYFWQEEYKEFHRRAWKLCAKVTKKGGMMYLNVSDFIRDKEIVKTVKWHAKALGKTGWKVEDIVDVGTPRFRDGANAELRVDAEAIIIARRT